MLVRSCYPLGKNNDSLSVLDYHGSDARCNMAPAYLSILIAFFPPWLLGSCHSVLQDSCPVRFPLRPKQPSRLLPVLLIDEVPITPSSGSVYLLEWFTEQRETL